MVTLYQLATHAETNDRIRWLGEHSDVEQPRPRTITSVERTDGAIEIEARGPQGGTARFRVEETGASEAWYGASDQEMGQVVRAELVDKDLRTGPWPA